MIKEQHLQAELETNKHSDRRRAQRMEQHTSLPFPPLLWEQSNYFTRLLPTLHNPLAYTDIPNYSHVHSRTRRIPFPHPHFQFSL